MLVYKLFREVSLHDHSSGLVIDDFSTVVYTEPGWAELHILLIRFLIVYKVRVKIQANILLQGA